MRVSPEAALEQFDLFEYIQDRFDPILETGRPDEYRIDCPFCGEEKRKFYVNIEKKTVHCFRCSYGADMLTFLARYEKRGEHLVLIDMIENAVHTHDDFIESIQKLKDNVVEETKKKNNPVVSPLPKEARKLFEGNSSYLMRKAERYILSREISKKQIRKHDFYFAQTGMFKNRIIIPTYFQDTCVTFVARDLYGNSSQKYLNPRGGSQGCWLFGWDEAIQDKSHVVVVEGVFDALGVERAGLPAVASFGKHITDIQAALLAQFDQVIMMYDDEDDAVDDALASAEKISNTEVMIALIQGGDPGEVGEDEIWRAVEEAGEPDSYTLLTQMINRT